MVNKPIYFFLIVSVLLVACNADISPSGKGLSDPTAASVLTVTPRVTDKKMLVQGKKLYQVNCRVCHGENAAGTKDWKTPDKSGKYPPPPLNGTAHSWHHSTEILLEVIKDGTVPDGNMPSWEGKLSDNEILLIIAWIQSLWPEDIFKTWQEIDLNSRED